MHYKQVTVGTKLNLLTPFLLTHGSSEGRKVSHCYRSRFCYGEPTCTACVVQFEVVVVAQKPRSQQCLSGSGRLRQQVSTVQFLRRFAKPEEVRGSGHEEANARTS